MSQLPRFPAPPTTSVNYGRSYIMQFSSFQPQVEGQKNARFPHPQSVLMGEIPPAVLLCSADRNAYMLRPQCFAPAAKFTGSVAIAGQARQTIHIQVNGKELQIPRNHVVMHTVVAFVLAKMEVERCCTTSSPPVNNLWSSFCAQIGLQKKGRITHMSLTTSPG